MLVNIKYAKTFCWKLTNKIIKITSNDIKMLLKIKSEHWQNSNLNFAILQVC